jgi:protein TonB
MLPNQIKQSDVLDIIFEHRNKSYGAYALRKSYNKRLALALLSHCLSRQCSAYCNCFIGATEPIYTTTINIDDTHLIDLAPTPPPQQPLPAGACTTVPGSLSGDN